MHLILVSTLFLVTVIISILYNKVYETFSCGCKKRRKRCSPPPVNETKYIPWPIFFGIPQEEEAPDPPTAPPCPLPPPTTKPPTMTSGKSLTTNTPTAKPIELPRVTFPPLKMVTTRSPTQTPTPNRNRGSLDPEMVLDPTILFQVRKELYPLINKERTCASLKGLVIDNNLHDAAQRLALEVFKETDLRTDYPNMSLQDQTTVDDRVKATGWKGATGAGNLNQIIQYSKLLYDTNNPPMVIKDIMCDPSAKNKTIMMSEEYTSVGIGYGRGNATDARTNTKSVYVLVFGKDPNVKAPPITPPKDGNCIDYKNKNACSVVDAPAPAPATGTPTRTPTPKR